MKKTYKQLELLGWKFTLTPMRFVLTALLLASPAAKVTACCSAIPTS
ncbi:MAG: hypothetical protein ACRCZU_06695 [Selenomonadaceae bacterium]